MFNRREEELEVESSDQLALLEKATLRTIFTAKNVPARQIVLHGKLMWAIQAPGRHGVQSRCVWAPVEQVIRCTSVGAAGPGWRETQCRGTTGAACQYTK